MPSNTVLSTVSSSELAPPNVAVSTAVPTAPTASPTYPPADPATSTAAEPTSSAAVAMLDPTSDATSLAASTTSSNQPMDLPYERGPPAGTGSIPGSGDGRRAQR